MPTPPHRRALTLWLCVSSAAARVLPGSPLLSSKARNVMLSTGVTDGRGIVGKVGDFGLSLQMDRHETHISQIYQGTMSHMAPGACVPDAAACPARQCPRAHLLTMLACL